MKVVEIDKIRKEMVGSKTEAWLSVDITGENEEEENLLRSKNTQVMADRTILKDSVRFRITIQNDCQPPFFVRKPDK